MVYSQSGILKEHTPWAKMFVAGATAVTLAVGMFASVFAATTVTVTPGDTQNWSNASTTVGGTVEIIDSAGAPLGSGALSLKTDATTSAKAQYMHPTATNLDDVTELSYQTKQVSASFSAGTPSYQLGMCLGGVSTGSCVGFTTLVYEPYVSEGNAAVQANAWQEWDVDAGKFYSTRAVGSLVASQGNPVYTLDQIKSEFPSAYIYQFGVKVGSNNPSYDTLVDVLNFNGTTYDFEAVIADTTAPDVDITAPTAGMEAQGDVTLTATITDNEALLRYYYFVRNVTTGQNVVGPTTVNTSEEMVNFMQTVDTTTWTDGEYVFQVEARDAALNKDAGSTDRVRFNVNNIVDVKADCKNGGWEAFLSNEGASFKNQGQCVAYVQSSANSKHHRQ